MWNRKKIYKYESGYYSTPYVNEEWKIVANEILKKDGYRIEVHKIRKRWFGTPIIYYYYVKEQSDVAED